MLLLAFSWPPNYIRLKNKTHKKLKGLWLWILKCLKSNHTPFYTSKSSDPLSTQLLLLLLNLAEVICISQNLDAKFPLASTWTTGVWNDQLLELIKFLLDSDGVVWHQQITSYVNISRKFSLIGQKVLRC